MIVEPITEMGMVLGGKRTVGRLRSSLDLHDRVVEGFPFGALRALGASLDLSPAKLALALGIAPATYDRRRRSKRLASAESEIVSRLARILVLGKELFGSAGGTWKWLVRSNRAFDGARPIELLQTESGGREVAAAIGRRLYGGYD